ncbi:MAG TPA: asparagine synthase (glutamine-hydrolyzing), partial [Syntrophales bacterium]|nr:asparagine synthase (glutamine-hydrolyzing) [Syntrophales bacterium]
MCGIAGKVRISEGGGLDPACMGTMLGMLRHRGPDESGLYIDDHAMLGQTRLSIIGIQGGVQPIHNEDETLWIVFNGEIFNYLELKEALVRNGHRFYTNTDTEVILHLFEEHGPSCLSRLNGQFAFALWDSRRKSLFLARDRLGIRPLHYTVRDGALIFASEIKAIFADRTIPRELDLEALHHVFSYWSVLPGETPFRDVRELEPGHFMVLADGRLTVQKYWDIPFPADGEGFERPLTEAAEELRELLLDAIRIRLRSDVPVGCYVSGGLDSTAIACLLVRNFSAGVRTFGIRFEDALFDEGRFQEIVVSEIGTRHTAVEATDEKIGQAIPDVLWHCERPLLRTAPVPLYLLSRSVREHGFKVVLTGEGADEVFGGYNIFREAKARHFIAKQPHS